MKFIEENKKFFGDCKHVLWLFKQMIVQFFNGNLDDSQLAWALIQMHWKYKSTKLR